MSSVIAVPIIIHNNWITGVDAKAQFYNEKDVTSEVTCYTVNEYLEQVNNDTTVLKYKDREDLLILNIKVEVKIKEYMMKIGDRPVVRGGFPCTSLKFSLREKGSIRGRLLSSPTGTYAELIISGMQLWINGLRDYEVSKLDLKAIREQVESVTIESGNPFDWCDPSHIKVLEIARCKYDFAKASHEDGIKHTLMRLRESHGSGVFKSLKCIKGSSHMLNYFLGLFNNREFEVMSVKNGTIDLPDLSVDILILNEHFLEEARSQQKERRWYRIVKSSKLYDYNERFVCLDTRTFNEIKTTNSEVKIHSYDLSDYHLAKDFRLIYPYRLETSDRDGRNDFLIDLNLKTNRLPKSGYSTNI